jgi:diacylglycerol kinase (ATP)
LTPLLVFINKLSGGQKGEVIYHQLIRLLNPRQVFILENDETIKQALDIYSSLRNTRILVCGGDGSIGWMLSTLANRFPSLNNPPVSICPMGTGNDLSRVLGWGSSYSMERLLTTLQQIPNAQPIALDRWQVDFEPLTPDNSIEDTRNIHRCLSCLLNDPKFVLETDPPSYQNYQKPLNVRCTNYISFGLDAAVVLDFHVKRMRDPSKFTSPFRNKIHYLNTARRYFREFALWKSWDLSPYMRLICDGKDFTDSLRHCHTIVLLNIPSYGAGTHPWSGAYADTDPININDQASNRYNNCTFTTDDRSTTATSVKNDQIGIQSISDRKLEVLGLDSIQMALIHLGLRGRHITQCSHVRIELIRSMPVHMDGDPFYLPKSTAVNVTHAGQVVVLRNEIRSS